MLRFYTSLLLVFVFLCSTETKAQEFYCNVTVNSQKIQSSDRKIFDALETSIYEFMNNKKWSNYNFKPEERIECNILLTINEMPSVGEFKGVLNLALRRPVFNSAYNAILLNYVDSDVHFKFNEFEPIQYFDNVYTDNLSSILAFYSYIFLGMDFDSFKLYGGTPFYQKAENVVSNAQNSNETGWKSFDGTQNRYWLVENMLNDSYKQLRLFMYEYHRNGLDVMSKDQTKGRAAITKSIPLLKKVYDQRPGVYLIKVILDAKRDEIINIYSEGTPNEKNMVVNEMKEIDAARGSDYQKILKSK